MSDSIRDSIDARMGHWSTNYLSTESCVLSTRCSSVIHGTSPRRANSLRPQPIGGHE